MSTNRYKTGASCDIIITEGIACRRALFDLQLQNNGEISREQERNGKAFGKAGTSTEAWVGLDHEI